MKLNKKLFILLIAVLSLISFTVGVKADPTISGDNGDKDLYGTSTGGGSYKPTTLIDGAAQILKLRVFGSDGKLKNTGYINISNRTSSISGNVCGLSDDKNRIFLRNGSSRTGQSLYNNSDLFECKSDKSITLKNINEFYGNVWGFHYSKSGSLSDWIKASNYSRLSKMLTAIGYTDWNNSDYVIVEPFLSVTCNWTNTYGTITALMERNIGFDGNMGVELACGGTDSITKTNLRQLYSIVAESFKDGSEYTCVPKDSPDHYSPNLTGDFSGCGYNRYNVSDMNRGEPGKILIKKTTTNGVTIQSSAKFNLYSDSACTTLIVSNLSTLAGTLEYKSDKIIKDTTYYLKETSAPSGYHVPKNNCIAVKAVSLSTAKANAKEIQNPSECEYDFDELTDKSMTGRIQFYLKYSKYKNYKNILNLNKTTGKDACTPITTKTNYESGCLGIKTNYDTSFKETNLSSYDSIQTYENNTYSFCKTIFSFNSNVGENGSIKNAYSYSNGKIDFGLFKSGKMVLSRNAENKKIAEGVLNIICYVYGPKSAQYVNGKSYEESDYNSKVKSVMLYKDSDKTKMNYLTSENFKSFVTNTNITSPQCIKHNVTLTYDYSLSPIYARYGSGEVVSKTSSLKKREIGNGIISSFKEIGKIKLKFDAKIGDETISNDYCTYSVKQELVKCIDGTCDDPDDPWGLNLQFRQISKSNPFPGKSGNGRKVGSNWCDGTNCEVKDNNIVKETITDKNDSYNSTGVGPKYIINLNSKNIKEIKEKYKGQSYDDFGKNCDTSSGTCANNFIDWMNNKGYLIIVK